MTEYFDLTIWLKNPKEKVVLKNITFYQVVDQRLFFLRGDGKMLDKDGSSTFGRYEVPFHWFNVDRIESMEATARSEFSNHSDKEKFIKEVLMGIPPKQKPVKT